LNRMLCENVRNIDPPIKRRSPLISFRLRRFHGGHASRETKPHRGHSFSCVIKGFHRTRGGVTLESVFTRDRGQAHGAAIHRRQIIGAGLREIFAGRRYPQAGSCYFQILGYVDAQNAVSALIRQNYEVILEFAEIDNHDQPIWRAKSVTLHGR
jgi:hypothetical protein